MAERTHERTRSELAAMVVAAMEVSKLRPLSMPGREARLAAMYCSDCATMHNVSMTPAYAISYATAVVAACLDVALDRCKL